VSCYAAMLLAPLTWGNALAVKISSTPRAAISFLIGHVVEQWRGWLTFEMRSV
jgi:hypothetical protein